MASRRVPLARDLLGSAILVSLVAAPLYLWGSLTEPFEPAKAAILRGLAAFLLPVFCVLVGTEWRELRSTLQGSARPMYWALLAYLGAVLISTAASITPSLSLWGSPGRAAGALTLAAFAFFCFTAALGEGGARAVREIGTTVTLASLPVMLYGLLQWMGGDTLFPALFFVPSFLGNPNWLGAWLILAVPLTCAQLVLVCAPTAHPGTRVPRTILGGLLALFLLAQLFTTLRLTGRGAVIGLGTGLFFFATLLAALTRRRLVLTVLAGAVALGVLVAAALALYVTVAPSASIPGLSPQSLIQRTGLQRVLIWESVGRLMRGAPTRLLTGYGPDTLGFVVGQAYPTDPAALEVLAVVTWDRAHTLLLDQLATVGLAGTLPLVGLIGAVILVGLRSLGLGPTAPRGWTLLALTVGGALVGALVAARLGHRAALSVLGLGGGVLGGLVVYVAARARQEPRAGSALRLGDLPPRAVLIAGLLSAILAHVAEIQFGFEVASSGLTFWVFIGLVAALARAPDAEDRPAPERKSRGSRSAVGLPRVAGDSPLGPGLLLGVVLGSMGTSLLVPGPAAIDWRVPGLLAVTWIVGSVLCALPDASAGPGVGPWWKRVLLVAGIGLGWGAVGIGPATLVRDRPLTLGPMPYLAFLAVSVILLTLARRDRAADAAHVERIPRAWRALALGGTLAIGLVLGYQVAFVPMLAEATARRGRVALADHDPDTAIALFRRAVALAPWRDYYEEMLAGAFWERARKSGYPEPWLRQSEIILLRARARNPLDSSKSLNLSTLNAVWAEVMPPPQYERLAAARRYAFEALSMDPVRSRADVEERLAAALLQQGRSPSGARAEAERLVQEFALNPQP